MQCDRCIKFKQPQEKAPLCPLEITYPFELIHLDFLSIGGKKDGDKDINVLVVTDHFTRYASAFVTPNQSAATVANVLVDKYFSFFGWPQQILTDQGGCFESNIFKELLHLCHVKRLRTSPYRPSTNGSCERFNLTLLRRLGTLPIDAKKRWQDWVPTLAHAYNCTMSSVMGYSPYYLLVPYSGFKQILEMNVQSDRARSSYEVYVYFRRKRNNDTHGIHYRLEIILIY